MTETPTERRLHRLTATSRHGHDDIAAIDKGRQAIALLRECELEWFPDLIASEIRALLTICQED